MVPQYEFLADSLWEGFAYGRNAVYPDGDHGNALLSRFPISRYQNVDISVAGEEKRGMLHCELTVPGYAGTPLHMICVHLGLREQDRPNYGRWVIMSTPCPTMRRWWWGF